MATTADGGVLMILDKSKIYKIMAKKDLHPQYFEKAKVVCACGNTFEVGAAKPELNVDICFKCHPVYTGEIKLLDTAGRLEKFKARRAKVAEPKAKKVRVKKN